MFVDYEVKNHEMIKNVLENCVENTPLWFHKYRNIDLQNTSLMEHSFDRLDKNPSKKYNTVSKTKRRNELFFGQNPTPKINLDSTLCDSIESIEQCNNLRLRRHSPRKEQNDHK